MKKTTYRILKFKARFLAYFFLIFVLLYVISGRIALSFLPDYRAELETYLSTELGVPVELGQIDSRWSGFDPIIEVRNISVNGADHAHLQLASIRFAFLRSILDRAPRIRNIELNTASLHVEQLEGNGWSLAGVDVLKFSPPKVHEDTLGSVSIEDVLNGANVQLVDAFLRVDTLHDKDKVWRLPTVSLSYDSAALYASGYVIRPNGLQPLLRFVYNSMSGGNGAGRPGELYIEARSAEFLDNIVKTYEWAGISLQEVDAGGRIWVDLLGTKIEAVHANLQINKVNWKVNQKSIAPILNSTANFSWHGNDLGHRIEFYDLAIT